MTMGLVMLGAIETNESSVTLADVEPIALLTGESEVIVVPADSPFMTGDDFGAFLDSETERVDAILRDIGLVS